MKTIMFLIVSLAIVISGCSGKPSASTIEELFIADLHKNGLDNYLGLQNFTKTNGLEDGENKYVVDLSYDVVFKKSSEEVKRELGINGMNVMAIADFSPFQAGFIKHKEAKIALVKSENGWILNDGK